MENDTVCGPLSQDATNGLTKLEGFLDALREKFLDHYTPSAHLCVDENLSLWKGRFKFKVYIPT